MSFSVDLVPAFLDNYIFVIHDDRSKMTAVVDPCDARSVLDAIGARGWALTDILNTHHHPDHTGGNLELQRLTGCEISGSKHDHHRIPGIDREYGDGDTFDLGGHEVTVLSTDGHTLGHIIYWIKELEVVFVGDTLFAMGCGRLFEGNPKQMYGSLLKIAGLPPQTKIYCAHEYTLTNAEFALTIDPGNQELIRRHREVEIASNMSQPTVPTTVALERATNPFLRATDPEIIAHLGMEGAEPWEVFAEIRRRRDAF